MIAAGWERVGEEYGFTGLVRRLELRYDGVDKKSAFVARREAAAGARLRPSPVTGRSRSVIRSGGRRYYERAAKEVRFYREIGASCAPELYHAAADDEAQQVVLLLEDLTGGRQGDVLRGCSVEDAGLVLRELASFHARWWGERAPTDCVPADEQACRRPGRSASTTTPTSSWSGTATASRPKPADLIDRLRTDSRPRRNGARRRPSDAGPRRPAPGQPQSSTLGVRDPVTVLDWQTVAVGPPCLWIFALFLYGSLAPDDRRAAEGASTGRNTRRCSGRTPCATTRPATFAATAASRCSCWRRERSPGIREPRSG